MGADDEGTARGRAWTWRGIVIAVLAVVTYVGVVFAYASGSDTDTPDLREPESSGALVYLDVDAVDGENFSIGARVSVYPGSSLLDANGYLVDDVEVDLSPTAIDGPLQFPSGTRVGALPVTLYSDGDITQWPFDSQQATDVVVRVLRDSGSGPVPVPAQVAVTNSLTGWNIDAGDTDPSSGQSFDITAHRTAGSLIFALAVCAVLLVLPLCALFVTIQTIRNRKKFQPPMVTWFAVMLFAVLPIRNLFPGNPPIGSWVDYTLVLWVVAGLATAMALYVLAWWRQAP
ncbi:DUF4436 domain-containing protein [Rhodococcoides yunnanense]|uniref:DUF4436 domain-containing protein n=1 Tax=Rhodococcoides yunnanense TaxID=278209 RepID=UPI0009FE1FD7|nr:DUF4436 domain-containing protein [Rhodococcus yunnanensis]